MRNQASRLDVGGVGGRHRKALRLALAFATCSVAAGAGALTLGAGGELPTEIRLFAAGVNQTEKGPYLFDAEAARRVMAHYMARGVDVQIDLEHLSTDDEAPNYDPDARGWAKLELRNGELWAVAISWTADGAARVAEKRQRYVSPYFGWEEAEDGQRRVVELVNFAICANPATHDTPALVAASKRAPLSTSTRRRAPKTVPVTSVLQLPPHLAARF